MSLHAEDSEAIESDIAAVIALYERGLTHGDAGAMREAFHPDARMYGHLRETDLPENNLNWPIQKFFERTATFGSDWNSDGRFHGEIRSITVSGEAAMVHYHQTGFRDGRDYDDFFMLHQIDGRWWIVCKVFSQLSR